MGIGFIPLTNLFTLDGTLITGSECSHQSVATVFSKSITETASGNVLYFTLNLFSHPYA